MTDLVALLEREEHDALEAAREEVKLPAAPFNPLMHVVSLLFPKAEQDVVVPTPQRLALLYSVAHLNENNLIPCALNTPSPLQAFAIGKQLQHWELFPAHFMARPLSELADFVQQQLETAAEIIPEADDTKQQGKQQAGNGVPQKYTVNLLESFLPQNVERIAAASVFLENMQEVPERIPTMSDRGELYGLVALSSALRGITNHDVRKGARQKVEELPLAEAFLYSVLNISALKPLPLSVISQWDALWQERTQFHDKIEEVRILYDGKNNGNNSKLYATAATKTQQLLREKLGVYLPIGKDSWEYEDKYKKFTETLLGRIMKEGCFADERDAPLEEWNQVITLKALGLKRYKNEDLTEEDLSAGTIGTLKKKGNLSWDVVLEHQADVDGRNKYILENEEMALVQKAPGKTITIGDKVIEGWKFLPPREFREGDTVIVRGPRQEFYSNGWSVEELPLGTKTTVDKHGTDENGFDWNALLPDEYARLKPFPWRKDEEMKVGDDVVYKGENSCIGNGSKGVVKKRNYELYTVQFDAPFCLKHNDIFDVYAPSLQPVQKKEPNALEEAIARGERVFYPGEKVKLNPTSPYAAQNAGGGVVVGVSTAYSKFDIEPPYRVRFEDGYENNYTDADLLFVSMPKRWKRKEQNNEQNKKDNGEEQRVSFEQKVQESLPGIINEAEQGIREYAEKRERKLAELQEGLKNVGISPEIAAVVMKDNTNSEVKMEDGGFFAELNLLVPDYSTWARAVARRVEEKLGASIAIPRRMQTKEEYTSFIESIRRIGLEFEVGCEVEVIEHIPDGWNENYYEQRNKNVPVGTKGKIIYAQWGGAKPTAVVEFTPDSLLKYFVWDRIWLGNVTQNLHIDETKAALFRHWEIARILSEEENEGRQAAITGIVKEVERTYVNIQAERIRRSRQGIFELQSLGYDKGKITKLFEQNLSSITDLWEAKLFEF